MESIIRLGVNLFDLGIFYYFISSFKKKRNVPQNSESGIRPKRLEFFLASASTRILFSIHS